MAATLVATVRPGPGPDLEMVTNITTRPASVENATPSFGSSAERLNCKIYGLNIDELSKIPDTDPRKQAMQAYTNYINQKLTELPEEFFNDIWSILGISNTAKLDKMIAMEQRMEVLASIADVMRSKKEEDAASKPDRRAATMSIDDIAGFLCKSYGVRMPETKSTEWNALRQLTFAMIGLLCMLFQASSPGDKQTVETTVFSIVTPSDSLVPITSQDIQIARRGITALLLGFGELCPVPPRKQELNNYSPEDLLHTSKLCFFSLSGVAQIRIEWVDNLGSHLHFDSDSASLKLFRLPSFCFANLAFYSKNPLYKYILWDFDRKEEKSNILRNILREVLLSYRVIFGADKKSRKLFRTAQPANQPGGVKDPVLSQLCSNSNPSLSNAMHEFSGLLSSNRAVFSANTDFPIFGHRLLQLQIYMSSQNPSSLRDFWNDRRNPFNFYTFWALILVGGFSIVLSLVQCLLSVAQVYLASKEAK